MHFCGTMRIFCLSFGSKGLAMSDAVRIHVLLPKAEAARFEAYCHERGHKKSTLIARLIREHLDIERFQLQQELFRQPRTAGTRP